MICQVKHSFGEGNASANALARMGVAATSVWTLLTSFRTCQSSPG